MEVVNIVKSSIDVFIFTEIVNIVKFDRCFYMYTVYLLVYIYIVLFANIVITLIEYKSWKRP